MNLEVVGRRVDVTAALREAVGKRADKLQKFFDRIQSLKVIIGAEGTAHHVEFVAHLVRSDMVVATASALDVYTAVEGAADKLEHQLRRYKEKLRDHRAKSEETPGTGRPTP